MIRRSCSRWLPVWLLLLPFAPAGAQHEMTIYRCVDPSGAVTLQNDVPCPKGSQQTVRRVGALPALPTLPASTAATKPAEPPPAKPASPPKPPVEAPAVPPAPIVRSPPPALFQCRTWDERDYLGDTAEPPATCVPLPTVGIDGSSTLAAGSACEMRQDACVAVAAEQLCAAWKKRVDEAEFRWKFGGARNDARKAEYERVARIYRESTCVP
ncbi:MAG: DUF4124 domain-containing protein [Pseudomonadota bacterium]